MKKMNGLAEDAGQQKTPGRAETAAVAAASIGNVIWGFSYLFIRQALKWTTPEILLAIRFVIAFFLLNIPLLLGKQKLRLKGKKVGWLIALGIMEPTYFFLESYGVYYTNATFSGVVLAVVPVLALAVAAVFLQERPPKKQILFSFLPVAGVILMTVSGSAMGVVRPLGAILMLGACFASAAYRTINRRAAEEFSTYERTYALFCTGFITFTIAALISVKGDLRQCLEPLKQPGFVGCVLVLSVLCSVAANLLVNFAAAKMPVVKLSIFSSLGTVCSMFAGVIFLKEPISAMSLAGSLLILVGIWQVTAAGETAKSGGIGRKLTAVRQN